MTGEAFHDRNHREGLLILSKPSLQANSFYKEQTCIGGEITSVKIYFHILILFLCFLLYLLSEILKVQKML